MAEQANQMSEFLRYLRENVPAQQSATPLEAERAAEDLGFIELCEGKEQGRAEREADQRYQTGLDKLYRKPFASRRRAVS